MLNDILTPFGIDGNKSQITPIGNGLINQTWQIDTGNEQFILQRVNTEVFKQPELIDANLAQLKEYLNAAFPDYVFVAPLQTPSGNTMVTTNGGCYRIFHFVKGSVTKNTLTDAAEAYEAAKQFGLFAKNLANFDASKLSATIPNFHNLALRYQQFKDALGQANGERLSKAADAIEKLEQHKDILDCYLDIQAGKIEVPLRVMHHDTKISNVLFDENGKGVCVIDLDTVMPGYYLSDVGDMMRSYLSPASEEETDLNKVFVREDFFMAIYKGYMSEMAESLSQTERNLFFYAGKMIIYMQALRFLTDYLNNDSYYGQKYEGHNLNRANNQIKLLEEYIKTEKALDGLLLAQN